MNTTETSVGQSHEIRGNEGMLHVEEVGTGGVPVIFAHSFGGNAGQWCHQIQYLHTARQVVAFDFRSHGRSDPGYNFSAEALAGDIEAVADELGIQRFVLVGHSMGGAASIAYAGAHPERIAGLVLAATPGKSSPEQSKTIVESLKTDAYDQVMQGYMKQLLENAKQEVTTQVMNEFRKLDKSTSIGVISRLFEFDPIPVLKNFKGPLLIVATTREKQQPSALMHQVPNVPVRVIEGTSHWIQLDRPDEFNLTMDDFLKQIQ